MKAIVAGLVALLFSAVGAIAQVQPSGTFTPGHTFRVLNPSGTVVGDSGGAAGSALPGQNYLTELGITNTGLPFCINDALTNAVGGYHQFCLGANALGGGLISYQALGGAASQPLQIAVNGAISTFPGTTNPRQQLGTTLSVFINASSSNSQPCGAFTCSPGSDSNNCLSITTPCQTIQHAVTTIANAYDFGSQAVNFQLADGTYNECVQLPSYIYTGTQGRTVSILGHSGSVSSTTVHCGISSPTFQAVNVPGGWILKNLNVTGSAQCLYADYHSALYWDGGNFGVCQTDVQAVNTGAFIEFINNNYTINGNTQAHAIASDGAEIIWQTVTGTVSSPITVSSAFLQVSLGGIIDAQFATFGGTVTGTKFIIGTTPPSDNTAVLYCGNGVDCNSVIPGSVTGQFASPTFNVANANQLSLYNNSRSGHVDITSSSGSTYAVTMPSGAGTNNQYLGGSTTQTFNNVQRILQFTTGTAATTTNSTQYIGISSISNTEVNFQIVPAAYTLANLTVNVNTAPGSGHSFVFTVDVAGAPSTMTCTIANTATTCTDVTHAAAVVAGAALDVSVLSSASAATTIAQASVQAN